MRFWRHGHGRTLVAKETPDDRGPPLRVRCYDMTSVDVVFDLDSMSRYAVRDAVEHDRTSKFRHVAFVSTGASTDTPKKASVLLEPDTLSLLRLGAFFDARGAGFASFLQGLTASWLQDHKHMGLPAGLSQQPALAQVLGALRTGGEPDLWVFTRRQQVVRYVPGYDRVVVFEGSLAKPKIFVQSLSNPAGEDSQADSDSESSLSDSDSEGPVTSPSSPSLLADLVGDPDMRASMWRVMSGALGTSDYVH